MNVPHTATRAYMVKAAVKLTPSQQRMRVAVEYLQHYMATYDKQYGYLDYPDRTLIDDVLYGLGRALSKEYEFSPGFEKFKKVLREHLRLNATSGLPQEKS